MTVLDEMKAVLDSPPGEKLAHYGMPRRSGRYPWGSGEDPYQHGRDFLGRVEELKKQGWTETPENIKEAFGLTTSKYRIEKALATDERRMYNVARAKSLKDKGYNDSQIGREMGVNESTVRGWFKAEAESRMLKARNTAEFLRKRSEEVSADGGMLDVGAGVERELGVSREKMKEALYILEREGWTVRSGRFEQATNPGKFTTQTVLCPPGTEYKEIYDLARVHSVKEYISQDGGTTFGKKFTYPESLDSKRVMIRYSEEGGLERDGTIELRRNVPDLSLGDSRYAQVRILVDGTHYMKGMAIYSDDMPDGVDVIFNTNKKQGMPMTDVLKPIKKDPDNPFGSAIKDADQGGQYWYDPKTGERVSAGTPGAKLGLINKRADQGDWSDWKDKLPSQFLGKQSLAMAKKQLGIASADKQAEFNDIMEITNPTIKKHLLQDFADSCDSAAVHLQAAALPGQKYHVIVPINTLKDTEVYAPGYEAGTKLALIRYPHGGTFEIPILTVTHKNKDAESVIGKDSMDAVCVNKAVADRLSGADFDGDTVMCIPTHNGKVKVTSTPELEGLKGFDSKSYQFDIAEPDENGVMHYYRAGREFAVMNKAFQQKQMGVCSNLITDMTLAGAKPEELARAVRHSMVIIDAEKHKLDYKQSAIDNNIAALHKEYQGKTSGGASTILSQAKGQYTVNKRQGNARVNLPGKKWYDPTRPEGALVWFDADDLHYTVTKTNKRTGETTTVTKTRHQQSTKMAEVDDAHELVSEKRHPMELVYAEYANAMKALANQARVEIANTGKIAYNKNAAQLYAAEVKSLKDKANNAEMNAPREREAQRRSIVNAAERIAADPDLSKSDKKKIKQQSLSSARHDVSVVSRKDRSIHITDREWEAIQAGAISENQLNTILKNTDVDNLRERATPRTTVNLSQAKINKINSMRASDYTLAEIAAALGVSTSTVSNYLK